MPTTEKMLTEEVSTPEAIARVLEDAGIDMVFGIQGGNMGRLYSALYDHQNSIRAVLVRHEQLASVMAEVYGRLTGKPGVAIGQGIFMLANGLLGTMEAQFGSSPMLILTDLSDNSPFSHHGPYQGGTGEYGTVDTRKTLEGVTKYTTVAHDPHQAVQSTQLAIKHALAGDRGAVGVVYHSDAIAGTVDPDRRPYIYPMAHYLPAKGSADPESVARAAAALAQAERPVIIAGNGVRISQAYDELMAMATALAIPVATSAAGKSVFPETHELALGPAGNFGQAAANAFVGSADLVLAVGTRLGPSDTAFENPALIDPTRQTLIQIDVEPKNAGWSYPCQVALVGDAGRVLGQLAEAAETPSDEVMAARLAAVKQVQEAEGLFGSPDYASDAVPIMPQRVLAEIHDAVAADAFVTCDAGENRLFTVHHYRSHGGGTVLMPGIGAMGYAVPAALACKLIHPGRQALAITGDGGFSMAINGLMTARDENLPIAIVVLNNGALGWVKHGQGDRAIASSFADTNYAEIARAMGCDGIRVEQPGELAGALAQALSAGRATVIDVVTSFEPSFRDVTSPLVAG